MSDILYWCPVKLYKHIKVSLKHCFYAVEISFFQIPSPIFDIASAVRIMVDLRFPGFFRIMPR